MARRAFQFDGIDEAKSRRKYPTSDVRQSLAGYTDDGGFVIRSEQYVDGIAKEAEYLRNWHPANGFTHSGDMQHVARIPKLVCQMQIKKYGRDWWLDTSLLRKFLNSSDGKPWRTSLGEV